MLIESSNNLLSAGSKNSLNEENKTITQRLTQSQAEMVLVAMYVLDHEINKTAKQINPTVKAALQFFGIKKTLNTDSDNNFGLLIDDIFDKLIEKGLIGEDVEENSLFDDDSESLIDNFSLSGNLKPEMVDV